MYLCARGYRQLIKKCKVNTRVWCSTDEVSWVIWSLRRNELNFPVNRITDLHDWQRTILALQKTTHKNVETKCLCLSVTLLSVVRLNNVTLHT